MAQNTGNYLFPLTTGNAPSGAGFAPTYNHQSFESNITDPTAVTHPLSYNNTLRGVTTRRANQATSSHQNATMETGTCHNQFGSFSQSSQTYKVPYAGSEISDGGYHIDHIASLNLEEVNTHLNEEGYQSDVDDYFPPIPIMPLGQHEALDTFYQQLAARAPGVSDGAYIFASGGPSNLVGDSNQLSSQPQVAFACVYCPNRTFPTEEMRDAHETVSHNYRRPCRRFFNTWTNLQQVNCAVNQTKSHIV
jgi:hypothetical protein